MADKIADKKKKIENKIKKINAVRAIYQRDFEEIEKRYKENEISKKEFEKKKKKHLARMEKFKEKIRNLDEELSQLV